MRRHFRSIAAGFTIGVLGLGAAVAGTLVPVDTPDTESPVVPTAEEILESVSLPAAMTAIAGDIEVVPEEVAGVLGIGVKAPTGGRTPPGTFLVGASRVSLFPAPTLFGGETWMTEGCTSIGVDGDNHVNQDHALPPIDPGNPVDTVDEIRSWPASSPDCIYLGGFGLGPVRPATRVGNGGVWIRSIAISNGEKTFVYQIADLVGWFARYDQTICADCGILDVRQKVASELGTDVGEVIIASTHSHATADTYGGWGGLPDWYRNQIRDSAVAGAKQAVANLLPGTVEVGEVHLRDRNNERRDTYYSNIDTGATWLQATTAPQTTCTGKKKKETCTTTTSVIATLATYAAHPTIVSENILHADWPGAAARRFESLFGGVGLMFEGGLGNASVSGLGGASQEESAENTGTVIAEGAAPDIARNAKRLASNEMASAATVVTHPAATNPGLVTLADVGLFDREFIPGTPGAGPPGVYHWSKKGELSTSGEDNDPEFDGAFLSGCDTAGPTVITTAGAHRVGELLIAFTPGEIFSNIAEVIKERADNDAVAMIFGQANDALGYIMQSFEFDYAGNPVTEYGTGTGEYEEVFAIDHCFGDHVLETVLESTRSLGFGG
jgi:hypothetical protein